MEADPVPCAAERLIKKSPLSIINVDVFYSLPTEQF